MGLITVREMKICTLFKPRPAELAFLNPGVLQHATGDEFNAEVSYWCAKGQVGLSVYLKANSMQGQENKILLILLMIRFAYCLLK